MAQGGRGEQVPLPRLAEGPAGASPDIEAEASNELLAEVQQGARRLLEEIPGSRSHEIDEIVSQVVGHVAFYYPILRLDRLINEPRWTLYLDRQALRRYLVLLRGDPPGKWARCDDESIPHARTILLADIAVLNALDRRAFDAIYLHGLSVGEAATVEGVTQDVLVRRLRACWASIQLRFPWLFGMRARSLPVLKEDPT